MCSVNVSVNHVPHTAESRLGYLVNPITNTPLHPLKGQTKALKLCHLSGLRNNLNLEGSFCILSAVIITCQIEMSFRISPL